MLKYPGDECFFVLGIILERVLVPPMTQKCRLGLDTRLTLVLCQTIFLIIYLIGQYPVENKQPARVRPKQN